jgi:hypothetical protein
LQSKGAVETPGGYKFKQGECEGENIYIARKKEGNAKRKTIKIKEYIILGCDALM